MLRSTRFGNRTPAGGLLATVQAVDYAENTQADMDDTSSENTLNAEISPYIIDFVPENQTSGLIQDGVKINHFIFNDIRGFKLFGTKFIHVGLVILGSFILAEVITTVISNNYVKIEDIKWPINRNQKNNFIHEPTCLNMDVIEKLNERITFMDKKMKILNEELHNIMKWRRNFKIELGLFLNNQLQNNFAHINDTIDKALELYDADKLGITDYALESAGGIITSIPNTVPYDTRYAYDILGILNIYPRSNPRTLIQPGILPGECFAFAGNIGWIRIMLAHTIHITAVTMEHTYSNLVSDLSSAPKDFEVYGLQNRFTKRGEFLGSFTYKPDGKSLQTFPINIGRNNSYNNVELHILSNHGNPLYTCVYRFRVHGNRMS